MKRVMNKIGENDCLAQDSPCIAEGDWKAIIRKDHPRLFFNSETWPGIEARASGEESELFEELKARADALFVREPDRKDYGTQAAEAAFVFLISREENYLDLAKRLLAESIDYYHTCYLENRNVNWYSFTRINAWAAYDWIFNSLSKNERQEMGTSFLQAVQNMQPTDHRNHFARENWSGPETGFYGTPNLLWFAGLATFHEGMDDQRAEEFLIKGHDLHIKLLQHRSGIAGEDGESASAALNYALAAYPWAEFNFFHTFRSATGRDMAPDWPYVAYLPGYIFWNWLPGAREFGMGDSYHITNELPLGELNIHLSQIIHFYGESNPACIPFVKGLLEKMPREKRTVFPYARFLLTGRTGGYDDLTDRGLEDSMPSARHFENMGQVFMRSGSGPEDTYALFAAGGILKHHKHFDNNHFAIFKKGFLALDTGSRPQPGLHLSHYYCRTVAHNCILIDMPGEVMPGYWNSGPAPGEEDRAVPNDGGQCQVIGSKVVAFETHDEYAYVAGDATEGYHPEKCRLALRQFVFVPPDYFVVFDRVCSTRPEARKTWLLHTAREPIIRQNVFSADQEEGRLFCRTILPEGAKLARVGGAGKQFWSGGRNWSLPEGFRAPETTELLGQWRVEVTPIEQKEEDLFLHLIQVGDASLKTMVQSELVRQDDRIGVRFSSGHKEWEIVFGAKGPPSGRIIVKEAGTRTIVRELIGIESGKVRK